MKSTTAVAARLELIALAGIPILNPGDDLAGIILIALARDNIVLRDGDVIVVASKAISRVEDRFVDLATVVPSELAIDVAANTRKDPRAVDLILSESRNISRSGPDVLVVRHKLGFIAANAGIDFSNAIPAGAAPESGPWALLLPEAPDASANALRMRFESATEAKVGVVISDSFSRPFRFGTVGAAIGVSGLPPMWDRRGELDLFGRTLERTITALADQVAAAADLVAGQAAEGRAAVLVRGLTFPSVELKADVMYRKPEEDLYS